MKMLTFRPGGVRLPDSKLTAGKPIVEVDAPKVAVVALGQHIGRPARAVVSPGDRVVRYQLLAEADGFISANVHSPVTGTVKSVGPVSGANGYDIDAIIVESTEEDRATDRAMKPVRVRTDEEIAAMNHYEIRRVVRDCGIVGLGGATFPTDVKLTVPNGTSAEVLIVNGAECEPYLTSDHALMLESAEEIMKGVEAARRACDASRAVVGIEENKSDAIRLMAEAAEGFPATEVVALRERYPQGGEKQLIKAITGREVPAGKLPLDAGAVVVNVGTAYAIWRGLAYGEPLVRRIVTVTGPEVEGRGNFRVWNGTSVATLLELAGASAEQGSKLVLGGPMMGHAAINPEAPTMKGTSGVLLLPPSMSGRLEPDACVRCARCVSVCPMGLEPYLISTLCRFGRVEEAREHSLANCIECGCCSYICPSSRPLLDFIRLGKAKR